MNGEIAELIALSGFGNAYLHGALDEQHVDLLETNSTFKYVRSVEFADCERTSLRLTDTRSWFNDLRRHGVSGLWLNLRVSGGGAFVNDAGGDMRTLGLVDCEAWSPTWEVAKRAGPNDTRIWDVEYRCAAFAGDPKTGGSGLAEAREELSTALDAATALSRRHQLGFTDWFLTASQLLNSHKPEAPYHPDMLPLKGGYSLSARQLVAACARAWVFGGAGSWNEVGGFGEEFEERTYDDVTRNLLEAVLRGFEAAANSVVR